MTNEQKAEAATIRAEIKRLGTVRDNAVTLYQQKREEFKKRYAHLEDEDNNAVEAISDLEDKLLDVLAVFKHGAVVYCKDWPADTLAVVTSRYFEKGGVFQTVMYRVDRILSTGKVAQRARYNRQTRTTFWATDRMAGHTLTLAPETHPLYIKYMRVAVMNRLQHRGET